MLFSSILFLFWFLPLVLLAYYLIPNRFLNGRNIVLLIASLIFYSWGEPVYVFLMIYSGFFNYFMALEIDAARKKGGTGKKDLVFTVIVNLFILGFFKYFGFVMDQINALTGAHIHYTALALPIGISFYTFQGLSYIFDVYRGEVPPQRKLLRFMLYLSMFPQLIAGPIVKYRDIALQLENRTFSFQQFGEGVIRFSFGLAKKVLVANACGAVFTDISGYSDSQLSLVSAWIGIAAYTLQIYFDFSGYSDMAIGLGKMFGFEFSENFNYPYISKSVTEFWRRWHISLSSWFREYLYIPLGGNRVPVPRHMLNLMIVWSLTGLWHGADWNFILWGAWYGVILILEKYVYGPYLEKAPKWLKHVYTMLIVMVGWTFFSASDMTAAGRMLAAMFLPGKYALANMTTLYLLRTNLVLLIIAAVCSTEKPIRFWKRILKVVPAAGLLILLALVLLSVASLDYSSYNPFLYFRF